MVLSIYYDCEFCEYKGIIANLNKHMKTHEGVVNNCDLCESSFKSKNGLKQHRQSKHSEYTRCEIQKFG